MKTYPGPADDPIWASERIDELEKLNAELLAVLKRLRHIHDGTTRVEYARAINQADVAIAKAEKET